MNAEDLFTHPEFECLTITLADSPSGDARERAAQAIAQAARAVLGEDAGEWAIEEVDGSVPDDFDLLPPEGRHVSVQQAWDMAYALRDLESIPRAEPLFGVSYDAEDEEPLDPDEEKHLEALPESVAVPGPPQSPIDWEWSPKLINAFEAWSVTSVDGQESRGQGVRVGHPDSGYMEHTELNDAPIDGRSRVRAELGWDLIEDQPVQSNTTESGHGLRTASVLMSGQGKGDGTSSLMWITGVAPSAELVPFRVAKKRDIPPTPVLLPGGARRLRQALYRAVHPPADCHVVSISLGWLPSGALHDAVKAARAANVIVCAAAGNWTGFVVWPARYPETIAVAGCTAGGEKWAGSCRGSTVDITAPAAGVYVAGPSNRVTRSSGTSFAVASVAGVAALWLSRWGREYIMDTCGVSDSNGEITLTDVFRAILAKADGYPPPPDHDGGFGVGIINARAVLETALPTPQEMRDFLAGEAQPEAIEGDAGGVGSVLGALAMADNEGNRAAIAGALGTGKDELRDVVDGVGEEVAFHILTSPALRNRLTQPGKEKEASATPESLGGTLDLGKLSTRLRQRLAADPHLRTTPPNGKYGPTERR